MTEPEATPDDPKRERGDERSTPRWVAAGAAMGIGSAALVAALLYANREKKLPKSVTKHVGPPPESD